MMMIHMYTYKMSKVSAFFDRVVYAKPTQPFSQQELDECKLEVDDIPDDPTASQVEDLYDAMRHTPVRLENLPYIHLKLFGHFAFSLSPDKAEQLHDLLTGIYTLCPWSTCPVWFACCKVCIQLGHIKANQQRDFERLVGVCPSKEQRREYKEAFEEILSELNEDD